MPSLNHIVSAKNLVGALLEAQTYWPECSVQPNLVQNLVIRDSNGEIVGVIDLGNDAKVERYDTRRHPI